MRGAWVARPTSQYLCCNGFKALRTRIIPKMQIIPRRLNTSFFNLVLLTWRLMGPLPIETITHKRQ